MKRLAFCLSLLALTGCAQSSGTHEAATPTGSPTAAADPLDYGEGTYSGTVDGAQISVRLFPEPKDDPLVAAMDALRTRLLGSGWGRYAVVEVNNTTGTKQFITGTVVIEDSSGRAVPAEAFISFVGDWGHGRPLRLSASERALLEKLRAATVVAAGKSAVGLYAGVSSLRVTKVSIHGVSLPRISRSYTTTR